MRVIKMNSAINQNETVRKVIDAAKNGQIFLLYDSEGREGETDLTIPAKSITPADVKWMRKDGGGLICTAIDFCASNNFGLPFMADILKEASRTNNSLKSIVEQSGDLEYDTRSSFSLWVNHRDTRTGIPDNDRSLTINKLGEAVQKTLNGEDFDFGAEFRSPGHVAILKAAEGEVNKRMGQTELSIAIAKMSGITPAMVVCEMLDDNNGKALSKDGAMDYARKHNLVFVEGKDILKAYRSWNF
ncbi:3,4-dihydroxy-2-butanone-4-phosphate synthase [Methanohalobium sp.]|uniref:3,4-dihydroxy-2-butanone-4-phosphate synthase n=1 Tax=Methanohalobium sp. TaxID=2837493 RepID=UPI0025F4F54C|nr:3,4-dihydroxy-2-butanone-4-phosphate synthase [Methanohalobium sp.]